MELLTLAPGSDRIPVELFQILKDDAMESAALNMQYAICRLPAGSHSLLQGIFPTQEWKPGLPHCRWILYQLSHRKPKDTGVGSLFLLQWLFPTQKSNQGLCEIKPDTVSVLSHVRLFATPWTVACQAPLSMGILQARILSGLPCPPPGDLYNPGIEPRSPALPADSLPSKPPRKPLDP